MIIDIKSGLAGQKLHSSYFDPDLSSILHCAILQMSKNLKAASDRVAEALSTRQLPAFPELDIDAESGRSYFTAKTRWMFDRANQIQSTSPERTVRCLQSLQSFLDSCH
jgi:hypothetical protein